MTEELEHLKQMGAKPDTTLADGEIILRTYDGLDHVYAPSLVNAVLTGKLRHTDNIYISLYDALWTLLKGAKWSSTVYPEGDQPDLERVMEIINNIKHLDYMKSTLLYRLKDVMKDNNLKFTDDGAIAIDFPCHTCFHDENFPANIRDKLLKA